MNVKHVHVVVSGRVQGVFYRASTQKKAQQLQLVGWVRNCSDGTVETEAQGSEENISKFIDWCKIGSQFSKVEHIIVQEMDSPSEFTTFEIKY